MAVMSEEQLGLDLDTVWSMFSTAWRSDYLNLLYHWDHYRCLDLSDQIIRDLARPYAELIVHPYAPVTYSLVAKGALGKRLDATMQQWAQKALADE